MTRFVLVWMLGCIARCGLVYNFPQNVILEEPFLALGRGPSTREVPSRMTLQRGVSHTEPFTRDQEHPPQGGNICVQDSLFEGGVLRYSNIHFQNDSLTHKGIWIGADEIARLPISGAAWENLLRAANQPTQTPNLFEQEDSANVLMLAKALVFARLKEEKYRSEVVAALRVLIATQAPTDARTLALGRELIAYVIAADLIDLRNHAPELDKQFRAKLKALRSVSFKERTLISTHEQRANNWGTHAGASRAAVAAYLNDEAELQRCAQVFRGWLGERAAYAGFKFGKMMWQADSIRPVGVNAKGAQRGEHSLDGALPEELRRAGAFTWPPPHENYVYEALQGALAQAVILHRAGFDVWEWGDRALLRAFVWLYAEAKFPASGDDAWQVHVVNHFYRTQFPAKTPCAPGKNVGWADWTHGADN